jgi:hypothetical protein
MDTMILNKADGATEEVEIVMTFKLEKFNNDDYVIYKNNDKYYAAKYVENGENTDLTTDLSDDEKQSLSEMFDKLRNGGIL